MSAVSLLEKLLSVKHHRPSLTITISQVSCTNNGNSGSSLENFINSKRNHLLNDVIGPWEFEGRGLPEAGAILLFTVSVGHWSCYRNLPVKCLDK